MEFVGGRLFRNWWIFVVMSVVCLQRWPPLARVQAAAAAAARLKFDAGRARVYLGGRNAFLAVFCDNGAGECETLDVWVLRDLAHTRANDDLFRRERAVLRGDTPDTAL